MFTISCDKWAPLPIATLFNSSIVNFVHVVAKITFFTFKLAAIRFINWSLDCFKRIKPKRRWACNLRYKSCNYFKRLINSSRDVWFWTPFIKSRNRPSFCLLEASLFKSSLKATSSLRDWSTNDFKTIFKLIQSLKIN
jgi:hypothetical protein